MAGGDGFPETSFAEMIPFLDIQRFHAPIREALQAFLKQHQIETGIHYPLSLNVQPAYARLKQPAGSFPRAEAVCQQVLSLPMHPAATQLEVEQVCAAIRGFYLDRP